MQSYSTLTAYSQSSIINHCFFWCQILYSSHINNVNKLLRRSVCSVYDVGYSYVHTGRSTGRLLQHKIRSNAMLCNAAASPSLLWQKAFLRQLLLQAVASGNDCHPRDASCRDSSSPIKPRNPRCRSRICPSSPSAFPR